MRLERAREREGLKTIRRSRTVAQEQKVPIKVAIVLEDLFKRKTTYAAEGGYDRGYGCGIRVQESEGV